MIEIAAPPTETVDVELIPERVLLGERDTAPVRRLGLGRPIVVPLTPEQCREAAPTLAGLDGNGDVRYCILQLDVSFYPADGEPHVRGAVGVALVGRQPGTSAVARALSPLRVASPIRRSTTFGLTLSLGFVEPGFERGIEAEHEEVFVIAQGEGESDPEWRFTRTKRWQLEGVQTLRMVVEMPHGAEVDALVAVSSTINRKKFGLISYRADLPSELSVVPLDPARRA
ncbi:hypothetical protein [Streptomyces sp. NPDC059010]|uniref:hypothetical protein n=1 Tax=Streptomyces sp. NPDC059010 TaxID=3346695 RepID=UPI0036C86C8B